MTSEQFTYWLQGFFEISDSPTLSENQIKIIRDHLDLVFTKVTPKRFVNVDFSPGVFQTKNDEEKYC